MREANRKTNARIHKETIQIRIDRDLNEKVKILAKANKRTLQLQVSFILENAVNDFFKNTGEISPI